MSAVPTFTTERLILKGPTMDDVTAYIQHFVDYDVIRFLSAAVPWPYPEGGVAEHLKNRVFPEQGKSRWSWGIFLQENPDELIGCVDLWRGGKPENRGFWLGKKFWGKGIMTEAVYPVIDYAFNELDFKILYFANALGNVASRRVKEKTGCKLIGTEPSKLVDPQFTESELWELKKEDWIKHKSISI